MYRRWLRSVSVAMAILLWAACSVEEPGQELGMIRQPIVNGKADYRHPAVGALVVGGYNSIFCTGTLICRKLVLTAAHCAEAAKKYAGQGATVRFRVDLPQGTSYKSKFYAFSSWIVHSQYTGTSGRIDHDIAIGVLKRNVMSTNPIPHNASNLNSMGLVGKKLLYMGYGLLRPEPNKVPSHDKQSTMLPVKRLTDRTLVSYSRTTNTCQGDSGGPALYQISGRLRVLSVNSYGEKGCLGHATAFRTDYYNTWILKYLNKHCVACSSSADCGPCFVCSGGKCGRRVITPGRNLCKPCRSPADCGGSGDICIRTVQGNRCGMACSGADKCCPAGYSCREVGPGQWQCVRDNDRCDDVRCPRYKCGPGERCVSGYCRPKPVSLNPKQCKKCVTDADCVDASGTRGRCIETEEGLYCMMPCAEKLFCPKGYTCKETYLGRNCHPVSGYCSCRTKADCHSPLSCLRGVCQRSGGNTYMEPCDKQRLCAAGHKCVSFDKIGRCMKYCGGGGGFGPGSAGSVCNGGKCNAGLTCFKLKNGGDICLEKCSSSTDCTRSRGGKCGSAGSVNICYCGSGVSCSSGYACNVTGKLGQGVGHCDKKSGGGSCPTGFKCTQIDKDSSVCVGQYGNRSVGEQCDMKGKLCKQSHLCLKIKQGYNVCFEDCQQSGTCRYGGKCDSQITGGKRKICYCRYKSDCGSNQHCDRILGSVGVCKAGECGTDTDCRSGYECRSSKCVRKPPQPDTAPPRDSGQPDRRPPDPGQPDRRPPDPGQPDTAPPRDRGKPDRRPPDPGQPDRRPPDPGRQQDKGRRPDPGSGPADSGKAAVDKGLPRPDCEPINQYTKCDDYGRCQVLCYQEEKGCGGCSVGNDGDNQPAWGFMLVLGLLMPLLLKRFARSR